MTTLLERNAEFITSRRGFAIFIASVLVSLALIRVYLFPGVGGDDGEQLVFSQYFSWGYQIRNPPMITWMLMGIQSVLGPSVLSVVALRTVILLVIYYLSYRLTWTLCDDKRLAALSAGSLLLVFYMGWNTIHGFSHSALVTAFNLAALLAVIELRRHTSPRRLIILGAVLGLGLMAKYSFAIFAVALFASAMADKELRRRLISPWLAVGFLLTLPVLVPQFQWLIDHVPTGHLTRADIGAGMEADFSLWDHVRRGFKGVLRLFVSMIGFLLPLWVFLAAVFWKALRYPPDILPDNAATLSLLRRMLIILVGLAAAGIVAVQSDRLRSHYMFVLIPFVPYFFVRFGGAFRVQDIQRFAAVVSLAGVALVGSLIGKYAIEPVVCGHCEDHIPYDTFAQQIREAGFRQGTIFAYFHRDPLAGNFRVRFPDSRIVSAKHPTIVPPRRHAPGQCLIIWPVRGAVEPKSATIRTANKSPLQTNLAKDHPSTIISANLPPYGTKPHQLEFVLLNKGAGECR